MKDCEKTASPKPVWKVCFVRVEAKRGTIREFIIEVVLVDGSDISISMINSQNRCRIYFKIIEYAISILTEEKIY